MTASRREFRNGAWQPAAKPAAAVADRPLAVAPAIPAVVYTRQLDAITAHVATMPHTCEGWYLDSDHPEWCVTYPCNRCVIERIIDEEPTNDRNDA